MRCCLVGEYIYLTPLPKAHHRALVPFHDDWYLQVVIILSADMHAILPNFHMAGVHPIFTVAFLIKRVQEIQNSCSTWSSVTPVGFIVPSDQHPLYFSASLIFYLPFPFFSNPRYLHCFHAQCCNAQLYKFIFLGAPLLD